MAARRAAFIACATLIVLVGAAVRWNFMDYPMRYDESWTYVRFTAKSPSYIATHYIPANHVLHSLMVRASISLFGNSPAALRLPAFVAGVLLISTTGWLAWSLFLRRDVVLLAMVAVSGSSQLIEYSANSRGYTWFALFAVIASILTVKLMTLESCAGPDAKPLSSARRAYWVGWGLAGALGAYTLPLMIYPVTALAAALLIRTSFMPRGSAGRRNMLRGLVLGSLLCGAGTVLLYLPILVEQGLEETVASRAISLTVYSEYFAAHGPMLVAVLHSWMRHSNIVWHVLLVVGFLVFLISAVRAPNWRGVVPLTMLLILPLLVWVQGVPISPPGWMYLLPVFLCCSAYGICVLPSLVLGGGGKSAIARRVVTATMLAGATLAGASTLANVSRQQYLSAWEHEFVDIEQVLAECEAFGTQRCALVTRYIPAKPYYMHQRGMAIPKPPDEPQVERVYIAVGTLRSLADLWHEGVGGFSSYGPTRLWRRFSRSTLYVAERIPPA